MKSGLKLGAFAVIPDEAGRVLLVHRRDYDLWNLPGGGVEPGETPWAAVAREVREETGLHVAVERLAGVYCWPEAGELIFSFVCGLAGGQLGASDETRGDETQGDETSGADFFPPGALPATAFAEHRERIADALAGRADTLLCVPTCISASEEVRRGRERARARDGQ